MIYNILLLEYDLLAATLGVIQSNQWFIKEEDQRSVLMVRALFFYILNRK